MRKHWVNVHFLWRKMGKQENFERKTQNNGVDDHDDDDGGGDASSAPVFIKSFHIDFVVRLKNFRFTTNIIIIIITINSIFLFLLLLVSMTLPISFIPTN